MSSIADTDTSQSLVEKLVITGYLASKASYIGGPMADT
jgi:hypothetical protein